MRGATTIILPLALTGAGMLVGYGIAAASSGASAAPTQLGVRGDAGRFARITGQRSTAVHSFIGWHQPQTISKLLVQLRPVPMLAIKPGGAVTRLDKNPQGYGSPDIPANSAQAYFPGNEYVDVVQTMSTTRVSKLPGTQTKSCTPHTRASRLPSPKWGPWGSDDPAYVERIAAFVKDHRRVEFLAYFSSKPGSLWDLASKPRSRAAYRHSITPLGR